MSWRRPLLRILVLVGAIVVFVLTKLLFPAFTEFWLGFLRQHGWFNNPTGTLEHVFSFANWVFRSCIIPIVAGGPWVFIGIVIGIWLDSFASARDTVARWRAQRAVPPGDLTEQLTKLGQDILEFRTSLCDSYQNWARDHPTGVQQLIEDINESHETRISNARRNEQIIIHKFRDKYSAKFHYFSLRLKKNSIPMPCHFPHNITYISGIERAIEYFGLIGEMLASGNRDFTILNQHSMWNRF